MRDCGGGLAPGFEGRCGVIGRRLPLVAAAALALAGEPEVARAEIMGRLVSIPIPQAAIDDDPRLAIAACLSLQVDLAGPSLFSAAGVRFVVAPGAQFYNHTFGTSTTPNPALFPLFPGVEFDTYVGTTLGFAQAPVVPGRYLGPGAAVVGEGAVFDVAWGAWPSTGPIGAQSREIARLTVIFERYQSVGITAGGEFRSSDQPTVVVPFLPLTGFLSPTTPEPVNVCLVFSALFAVKCGRMRIERR